ncbi:MAG: hypothetical protein E6G79_22385 [Alphaproteobacteria bacterium]|nr:MAG: hypothetical protein E6G79_22385 [Alphaproteobacteria bacterium]
MSDLDNNRRLDPRDSDGISTGTIAAIIAVVVIIGALLPVEREQWQRQQYLRHHHGPDLDGHRRIRAGQEVAHPS